MERAKEKNMQNGSSRLKSIEGIRGLAALIVFVHHFAVMFYPAFYWGGEERSHCNGLDIWIGQTPFAFFINGNSGVVIFLMLTGFGTYMICRKGTESYVKYIVLRYVKLLILAIFASIFVLLLFQANLTFFEEITGELQTPWFGNWNPRDIDYISLLKENPIVSLQKYNNTLWTMKYVFYGAILCVVLYLICSVCHNRYLIYLLCIIILINMQDIYYIPCVVGFLLADIYCYFSGKKVKNAACIILVALGIYFCAYPTAGEPTLTVYSFLPYEYRTYYHIFGAACIISATLFGGFLKRCMEMKIMQFFGKYSMSIYMVHYGILISFSAWFYTVLRNYMGYNKTALCNLVVTSCVVIIAAFVFQKIIDLLYSGLNRLYDVLFVKREEQVESLKTSEK